MGNEQIYNIKYSHNTNLNNTDRSVTYIASTSTVTMIAIHSNYLVSDLDKEDEDNDNKQVAKDADNSSDYRDDLDCSKI